MNLTMEKAVLPMVALLHRYYESRDEWCVNEHLNWIHHHMVAQIRATDAGWTNRELYAIRRTIRNQHVC